jgi:hypothetical protein
LLYHLRLQPSEVENLSFYEYENIVQNLIDILKEKQEAEEKQSRSSSEDTNVSKIMRDANKYMPAGAKSGMPSMPNMSSVSNFPGIPSSLKI